MSDQLQELKKTIKKQLKIIRDLQEEKKHGINQIGNLSEIKIKEGLQIETVADSTNVSPEIHANGMAPKDVQKFSSYIQSPINRFKVNRIQEE